MGDAAPAKRADQPLRLVYNKREGLGLPSDGALWLRGKPRRRQNHCYRLVRGENGEFTAGLYLDWAEPQELTFTLLWQQDGKIVESERLV